MSPTKARPLGNRIRRLRFDNQEMTQEALAQAVGITRQTVIALEAERYAPSLDLAMRIADTFGQRVDEVFFRRAELDGEPPLTASIADPNLPSRS